MPRPPTIETMTSILITGANKGLGKATARLLVEHGHTVHLGARDAVRGQAAADEIGARFVQLDVTDDASVSAAFAQLDALDVLVNNAGIASGLGGVEALDGPSVLATYNTNVAGDTPVVVNVSSALGSFAATHDPSRPAFTFPSIVYGSSKAAVSMLTVQYAKAYPGIRFNAVEPGITATELGGAPHPGRPGEESARLVVRLAEIGVDGPTGTFWEDDGVLGW